jgi:hypothetical protein
VISFFIAILCIGAELPRFDTVPQLYLNTLLGFRGVHAEVFPIIESEVI